MQSTSKLYHLTNFDIHIHQWNLHHSHEDCEFPWCLHSWPLCFSHLSSWETLICFCLMDFFASPRSLFQWNHAVSILILLPSFTQHNILRFIHVVLCISISFFLLLSSIPLYGYTTAVGYIHLKIFLIFKIILKF